MMSINRILAIAATTTTRFSTVTAFTSSPIISTSTSTSIIARSFQTSTSLLSAPPTRYLLNYEYIPDVLEKRGPFREGHIGLAKDMIEKGRCVSGGPTLVPGESVPNGALFIFNSKEAAEDFVKGDPYVEGGIVTSHSISEWSVVVGNN